MLRKALAPIVATVGIVLSTSVFALAQSEPSSAAEPPAPTQTGYASVNGLEMYYEVYGSGQPLILLHGGLGGIPDFVQLLPALAQNHEVIAVELQAHGHTADIDRPLSFESMADDVAALIDHFGYKQVDVLGYSLGGGVALQTAIRHPDVVRKLVLISTAFQRMGLREIFRTNMEAMNAESAKQMLQTPMYQFYSSVAPKPDNWPTLVAKSGDLLRQDYDWSSEVATIKAPTLIIAGDSDDTQTAHAVDLFRLLGGDVAADFVGSPNSQLAILPGTSHFTIMYRADLLMPLITSFLEAPLPAAK